MTWFFWEKLVYCSFNHKNVSPRGQDTSSFFNIGKKRFITILEKNPDHYLVNQFKDEDVDPMLMPFPHQNLRKIVVNLVAIEEISNIAHLLAVIVAGKQVPTYHQKYYLPMKSRMMMKTTISCSARFVRKPTFFLASQRTSSFKCYEIFPNTIKTCCFEISRVFPPGTSFDKWQKTFL